MSTRFYPVINLACTLLAYTCAYTHTRTHACRHTRRIILENWINKSGTQALPVELWLLWCVSRAEPDHSKLCVLLPKTIHSTFFRSILLIHSQISLQLRVVTRTNLHDEIKKKIITMGWFSILLSLARGSDSAHFSQLFTLYPFLPSWNVDVMSGSAAATMWSIRPRATW